MTRPLVVAALLMGAIAWAPHDAGAQETPITPAPFKRWDLHTGVGLRVSDPKDATMIRDTHDLSAGERAWTAAVGIDVGHYWTDHLKTEVGILHHTTYTTYFLEPFTAPGGVPGQTGGSGSTTLTEVLVALTRQFGKNQFTHPYLSSGLRSGLARIRERGTSFTEGNSARPYYRAPLERQLSELIFRPYIAAGAKFYFNERAFIRSELALGFWSSGLSQWTLRAGFGSDF